MSENLTVQTRAGQGRSDCAHGSFSLALHGSASLHKAQKEGQEERESEEAVLPLPYKEK